MQRTQGILATAAPGASEAGRAQALLRWVVASAAVQSLCTLMREASSVYQQAGADCSGVGMCLVPCGLGQGVVSTSEMNLPLLLPASLHLCAGDDICGHAARSARTALGAVVRCVLPAAASSGAPAFPLAAALSEARPSSSIEAWQQAQSQLLSSLRSAVATELCADADTMAAFAAPLMTADESADVGRSDVAEVSDGDTDAVLHVMLACCVASPAFCDRVAAVDLHEVRL